MSSQVRVSVLPYGPGAVLACVADLAPAALAHELRRLPGVIDAVPGAETVLLTFDTPESSEQEAIDHFTAAVHDVASTPLGATQHDAPEIQIPVRYDGEDLAAIADRASMGIDEVIERHTRGVYRVAFMGFAPGFGYLEGLDIALHLPRRSTPRASVPAGAVAIAGKYAAVYPRSSPGGWLLLGYTDIDLFDEASRSPALLSPGATVRFEPI